MKKKICILGLVTIMAIGTIPPLNMTNRAVSSVAEAEAAAKTPSASALAKAVKKAYGKKYIPNMELSKSDITNRFSVSSKWYSSAFAELPMISTHVDTLAIFIAKDKTSKKKILSKLKAYRKQQIENTMQYPMNIPKVQASKVYTNGNYVCFIMLGQISNSIEESGDENAMVKAYQKQNNIAVNAIKKALK